MTKANRIYLISLSILYLAVSVGFGIRAHYCHGDLSSITYVTASPDCECGDEEAEMSCCTTIDQYFQFNEEGITTASQEKLTTAFTHAEILSPNFTLSFSEAPCCQYGCDDLNDGPPKYILHSSLILYA